MGDRSFEAFPVDLVGLRLAYSRIHTIITAGIPGSCPLQDVGESLLTVSWLFQRPVNGVGQANGLRRGRVWLTYGRFMCRKLPCRLRKQFLLPEMRFCRQNISDGRFRYARLALRFGAGESDSIRFAAFAISHPIPSGVETSHLSFLRSFPALAGRYLGQ